MAVDTFDKNLQLDQESSSSVSEAGDALGDSTKNKNSSHPINIQRVSEQSRVPNFRQIHMPVIIIQEKPQKLYPEQVELAKEDRENDQSFQARTANINYNNLVPVKQSRNFNAKNFLRQKKHSVQIHSQNIAADQEQELQNLKQRTSSVRIIAHRPSFLIIHQDQQQQKLSTLAQGQHYQSRENRFVSPISIQRIFSVQNEARRAQLQITSDFNQTPLSKKGQAKDPNAYEKDSSTYTGKKSISEAVSIAIQNSIRHKMSQRFDNSKMQEKLRQITNQNSMFTHLQTQGRNNLHNIGKMKGGFTEAVTTFRGEENKFGQNQEEQKRDYPARTEKDKRSNIDYGDREGQGIEDLDDYLLGNQSEFPHSQNTRNLNHNPQSQKSIDASDLSKLDGLVNMKQYLYKEIQRRFSKNIEEEMFKYQQTNAAISKMNTEMSSQIIQKQNNQQSSGPFQLKQQQASNYISVLDHSQNNTGNNRMQPIASQDNSQIESSFVINNNFIHNFAQNNLKNPYFGGKFGDFSGPLSLDQTISVLESEASKPAQFYDIDYHQLTNNSSAAHLGQIDLQIPSSFPLTQKSSTANLEFRPEPNQQQYFFSLTNNTSGTQLGQFFQNQEQLFSLTNNSSAAQLGLTVDQMQLLFERQQNNFDSEQHIEFIGDPQMVGLVQLNADMCHIAMNVFETFTLFDLLGKCSQQHHEDLQLLESQQSIISQRQDTLDYTLDIIEQQLLKIKALKQFRQPSPEKENRKHEVSEIRLHGLQTSQKYQAQEFRNPFTQLVDQESQRLYDREVRLETLDFNKDRAKEVIDTDNRLYTTNKTLETEEHLVKEGLLVQVRDKGRLIIKRVMNQASQLYHNTPNLANAEELNY